MDVTRFLKHSLVPHWWALRVLPRGTLDAIERAIGESEKRHSGELRFVVEGPLPAAVLGGRTCRQRAIDLFSQLRVWDTEANSGVLIYVQLIDRKVEIVDQLLARAIRSPVIGIGQCHYELACGGGEDRKGKGIGLPGG